MPWIFVMLERPCCAGRQVVDSRLRGGCASKSRNEGGSHDLVDNKGSILGTHDIDENK